MHDHADPLQDARLIGRQAVAREERADLTDHAIEMLASKALRRLDRGSRFARKRPRPHAVRTLALDLHDAVTQRECWS